MTKQAGQFLQQLRESCVIFDGGMGSLLQARGLPAGVLPETWNITHPEVLADIHRSYLGAGAHVVTTNTFGANPFKYPALKTDKDAGVFSLTDVITAAVGNAKAAIEEQQKQADRPYYVALDMGPTGKLLAPMGDLDFEDCVEAYKQVVEAGAGAGADLILIETMSDLYELKAAVLAAKEACDLPVVATVAFDATGKLLTGGTPRSVVALLEGLRVDALGLNCGLGPADMAPYAKELLRYASVPVLVQPNAGLPRSEGGKTVYDLDAEAFAEQMQEITAMGARALGGCCGTTPAHIAALVAEPVEATNANDMRNATLVSSFADAVIIGDDPVVIGERINPTGKKRFQQALREADMEYILNVGLSEQEQGAHILDVNVGIPEVDEPALMEQVVKELQSVTELPLQLDSSDPKALARSMRIYNGKPLINSVNGKQAVMDAVFPLVQKYGGVVVCLCIGEDGIPDTADGRVAVAKRIAEEAAKYGIPKKDLLVDTLCMTISSDPRGALTTLEATKRVREELGIKTVLGVSNISFGLPRRELINAAFFTMAMENGLNAAIINPGSEDMMRALLTFRALHAFDTNCEDYIGTYAGTVAQEHAPAVRAGNGAKEASGDTETDTHSPLFRAIRKGLKDQALVCAREALSEMPALEIIDRDMMPALDEVGKGFEQGSVFLPQLIMSAEAAKAAFDVIREKIDAEGAGGAKKGKIILATVKGDIHDIGKNIVKVLLENYNYEVIDLGKDVSPETIADTAREQQVPLVGLSALMTTTVPAMEETVKLLRKQMPGTKVMVGGAVLTGEYAEQIGADFYGKDAMGTVQIAESVFSTSS